MFLAFLLYSTGKGLAYRDEKIILCNLLYGQLNFKTLKDSSLFGV